MNIPEFPFVPAPKIARLNRKIVITCKIDGTRGTVFVTDSGEIFAGSRNRWLVPGKEDNFGFAEWVEKNADELRKLGPGRHDGEFWGCGIQRNYGQSEKIFSLFDVVKWSAERRKTDFPACCRVVPILYHGDFNQQVIEACVEGLRKVGSAAAPGFMQPEGVVVYHLAAGTSFKVTLENDEQPKTAVNKKEKIVCAD